MKLFHKRLEDIKKMIERGEFEKAKKEVDHHNIAGFCNYGKELGELKQSIDMYSNKISGVSNILVPMVDKTVPHNQDESYSKLALEELDIAIKSIKIIEHRLHHLLFEIEDAE